MFLAEANRISPLHADQAPTCILTLYMSLPSAPFAGHLIWLLPWRLSPFPLPSSPVENINSHPVSPRYLSPLISTNTPQYPRPSLLKQSNYLNDSSASQKRGSGAGSVHSCLLAWVVMIGCFCGRRPEGVCCGLWPAWGCIILDKLLTWSTKR